jgi:[ribosomal protein S5]-alanine N-acetyltransferase
VIIETPRLTLRPLSLDDAPAVQELLNDPTIAEQLPSVNYPLAADGAEAWISEAMNDVTFACVGRTDDTMGVLGGFIGLHLEPGNRAQIGGWCGAQFRHNGYAVEAGRAVVKYGYEVLGLETIYALRKGRLWVASPEADDRHLQLRNAPEEWHMLDRLETERPNRNPLAKIGERLTAFLGRS